MAMPFRPAMKNQCICLENNSAQEGTTSSGKDIANVEIPFSPKCNTSFKALTKLDARLLRSCSIESEAILTNRIGTTLLKRGAAAGLSLSEIAALCLRSHNSQSMLERHVRAARCRAKASKRHSIGNTLACSNVEGVPLVRRNTVIAPVIFVRPSTILILMHWSEIKGHGVSQQTLLCKDEEM